MEYGHDRAVADGVNVDYHVYRINTEITALGGKIERNYYIDRRDRKTRARRWEPLDADLIYTPNQLDRAVVAPDQIRTVIRAFKDTLFTDLFPGRKDVPKTLIFAKDDSHADDIVQIVRKEFGKGNDFAQKITYKTTGVKPEDLIQSFRNSYNPRIAVTIDMIATGTDIKPLEILLFMRSVKSQSFFEQMKGRGTRIISDSDFQSVTAGAIKTHFVIVDAVGVYERLKVDDPPLDRQPSIPLEKLLEAVAIGKWRRDPDILPTLAARLGRLAARLTPDEAEAIERVSGGQSVRALANGLVRALDPDAQLEQARINSGMVYDPPEPAIKAAAKQLLLEASTPFDNPDLRQALLKAQQRDEQIIDTVSQDTLLASGWDVQAEEQARQAVTSFREFIERNRDEIIALQIIYNRPAHTQLHFNDLKQLRDAIALPPLGLTTDKLWQAYATLDRSRVRDGNSSSPKRPLADLVSLIRYTIMHDNDDTMLLEPHRETVARRFASWLADQERLRGQPFPDEQRRWLEWIRDIIETSLAIDARDFDNVPFNQHGGSGKAYELFGPDFPCLLDQLNERLAA
jgi:type I restriction enzyme, R subunit